MGRTLGLRFYVAVLLCRTNTSCHEMAVNPSVALLNVTLTRDTKCYHKRDYSCLESSLSFAVKTTIARVVLHNFCLEANDKWDSDNDNSDNDSDDEDGGALHDADEMQDLLKDFTCRNV